MGKKTLWRYENGYIPDKAQNALIRLMDNPVNFRAVYEAEKEMLRPDEIEKVEQALSQSESWENDECVIVNPSNAWSPGNIVDFPTWAVTSAWDNDLRREYAAIQ